MSIIDFENRTRWIRDYNIAKTCTPIKIAKDMISLIDEKYFNPDSKFLDIYCKSGTILEVIKDRLMDSKSMIEAFPSQRDRWYHILEHQIYGLVWEDVGINCEEMSNINVFGTYVNSNIKTFKIASTNKKDAYKILDNITFFKNEIQKIFGEENMKFNIVVGNPPYNRKDDQLRFAIAGYQLATDCTSMIIPAKWQNKNGSINEEFREKIVPHMKEIVFFPNVEDVFSIMETSGTGYYMADKNTYGTVKIKNICRAQKLLESERERELRINNEICLSNIGYDIIKQIGSVDRFVPSVYDIDAFNLYINSNMVCGGGDGGTGAFTLNLLKGQGYITGVSEVITRDYLDTFRIRSSLSRIYSCKTKDEIKSFISYEYTKFVRFLIFCSIAGLTSVGSDNWWRFVPNQKFDHIFTDQELYAKYNLTEEMIQVIEKTIKERKIKDAFKFIG